MPRLRAQIQQALNAANAAISQAQDAAQQAAQSGTCPNAGSYSGGGGGVFCQCSSYIAHRYLNWPAQDLGPANGADMGRLLLAAGWHLDSGARPCDVAVMGYPGGPNPNGIGSYGHVAAVVAVDGSRGTFVGHGANQGGSHMDLGCDDVNEITFSLSGPIAFYYK